MSKIKIILISIFVLLLSGIFYYYKSQNVYSGTLRLNNSILSSPVKIHTDQNGLIHIKAINRYDATFAIGVVHARDRLWQMEFFRRTASGTLSEMIGEKALPIDKMSRTVGFRRIAEKDVISLQKRKDHEEILKKLNYYLEGVNYYATTHYHPLEFILLRIKFTPWEIVDLLSYLRLFSFTVMCDHTNELLNKLFYEEFGKEYFDMLYDIHFPLYNETIVTAEEIKKMGLAVDYPINLSPDFEKSMRTEMGVEASNTRTKGLNMELSQPHASNCWAVHGSKTKSGKPIFNNDPHLGNSIPGLHTLMKIYIGANNEEVHIGSAPPGLPFILIGNNDHFAYGFTTDNRDISDFVEEKLDNADISQAKYYFIDDKQYPLETFEEIIKVKGKEDYKHVVKNTKNGPLIEEWIKEVTNYGMDYKFKPIEGSQANAVSAKFFTFKESWSFLFIDQLMYGKGKEDFLPASEDYIGPSFSLSWAHINGEIGYSPVGHFPIKKNPVQVFSKGYLSTSSTYSTDYIHRKDQPVLINPPRGYIVTANNSPFPANYKYYSTHYSYNYRFYRISSLIEEVIDKKKYDTSDALSILGDTKDLYCRMFLDLAIPILERNIKKKPITDEIKSIFAMLKNFNCDFKKNSKEATIFTIFETKALIHLLLKNEANDINLGLKTEQEAKGILYVHSMFYFLYLILQKIENRTISTLPTCRYFDKTHTCEEYLYDVLVSMPKFIEEGGYIDTKTKTIKEWSEVHHHYYTHQFDAIAWLKPIFARKTPTDGNRNTIKVSKIKYQLSNDFTSVHSANLKYMNDLSDIRRPYVCLDTGNSGNLLSKYYDNLMVQCEANKLIRYENHNFNSDENTLILLNKE